MKFLSFIVMLCVSISFANEKGNGGDMCENRIAGIGVDLKTWIEKGGASALRLPFNLSYFEYERKMLGAISEAKISCTADRILIGQAEKTCKNWISSDGETLITCNAERFMKTSEADQYVLVHHEYAGLSGFEVNLGETSDYTISNQITGFLEDHIIKKLVVKPAPSTGKYVCTATCDTWEGNTLSIMDWSTDSMYDFLRLCDNMGGHSFYPADARIFQCNYTVQKSFPITTSPWNQEINATRELHHLCYANNVHSRPAPPPPATSHDRVSGEKINDKSIKCHKI